MNLQEIEAEYRDVRRPMLESLGGLLHSLLSALLNSASIDVGQIEHRVKTVESFIGKIERKAYDKPLEETKDLLGLRVITYYNDDVHRVSELVRKEFAVDDDHSLDKASDLEVEEFGYRSVHIVARLGESRAPLAEWKPFRDLWFEIQIRTVLQHAWAVISHSLDYKSASEVPRELRRQLFRMSALLELADEEFAVLRDRSKDLIQSYKEDVDRGDLEIPINYSSLQEYTRVKLRLSDWETIGMQAGMIEPEPTPDDYDTDIRRLHKILRDLRVERLSQLETLLQKHKDRAVDILTPFVKRAQDESVGINAVPLDVITFLLSIAEKERLPDDVKWPDLRADIETILSDIVKGS